jgi:glycerol-3-phosphate acyltransferase PlsY
MALASLVGDLLKGVIAAWLGLHFGGETLGAVCAAAAVIGHCWTVFLGFKGGKGIATSAGTLLVLMPTILLILLATFVTIVAVSRFVSLGSVCVAILFPILTIIMNEPLPYILMSFVLAGTVIFRHRTNIDRLRRGVETKINEKAF